MERQSHTPAGLRRRRLLQAAGVTAAGFALAVQPVRADRITTDISGIAVGDIVVPHAGVNIPLYVARPIGDGPFPGVIVIHEIFAT